ncbi:unnamed protein product [Pieris brassicae]|uniref:Uncharacterized protein n=1 Tax=Pieris brassicae TaxID=7116 RepID=A0A9P0TND6_PIEBR|nr:unnamed protein product [Pieris brassicae]
MLYTSKRACRAGCAESLLGEIMSRQSELRRKNMHQHHARAHQQPHRAGAKRPENGSQYDSVEFPSTNSLARNSSLIRGGLERSHWKPKDVHGFTYTWEVNIDNWNHTEHYVFSPSWSK